MLLRVAVIRSSRGADGGARSLEPDARLGGACDATADERHGP
jgi:hypothetical protein